LSTPIRFKGVVDSTANIELGKYQGRIGFDTTISRYIAYYDATNSAVLARRDIAETFAGKAAKLARERRPNPDAGR
jgi:hypothetical protein